MGSMNDLKKLLDQVTVVIFNQALRLDDVRLHLFLNWLKTWFEALPVQGLLWEYQLIPIETAWWHNLDAHCLNMILKSEAGK